MGQNVLMMSGVLHEFGIMRVKRPGESGSGRFIVDDPIKISQHGLRGARRGDQVEVVELGGGELRIDHLASGGSVTGRIQQIQARGQQNTFRQY